MSLLSASLLFCSISFAEEPSSQTDSDESKVSVEEPESDSKSKTPSSIVESFEGSAVLLNGDRLTGMIYVYSDERVVIQLNNKVSVQLTKSVIKKLIPKVGKYNIEDKGTTRYFYTPTAMPLNELSGYVSQKELLFTAVAYSPRQNWSFLVGTSLPWFLFSIVNAAPELNIGVFGLRYGSEVRENVYVGGGIETFAAVDGSFSLPFVNATFGNDEGHVTLSAGVGLWDFDTVDFAPLNVSTYKRIGPSLAFVTENWAMVTPTYDYTSGRTNWSSLDAPVFLSATGLRFISQKFSTDVAIVNTFVDGTYIPIPWIDISWYFDLNVD